MAAEIPDEQRPDQAWALRYRDGVHFLETQIGFLQSAAQHRLDQLQVLPRSDLRNDSAKASVQLGLRGDDVRAEVAGVVEERRGGLVAGGLDRQNHVLAVFTFRPRPGRTLSRHMIKASSWLSR